MSNKIWAIFFLMIGLCSIIFGLFLYNSANLNTKYNIPNGAIQIGVGPAEYVSPITTKMVVWVPQNKITLEVYFNFTEYEEYFIYITMPYETIRVNPYVMYQGNRENYNNSTSWLGVVNSNFKNFTEKGSSAVNATFTPNEEYSIIKSIGLSIEIEVTELTSIKHSLDSKHTTIFTLFGGQGAIYDKEFTNFSGTNKILMDKYPFQLYVQFPQEYYLSPESYPTPYDIYVSEDFKSAEFHLNGTSTYPEWRGFTVSCSYVNPDKESAKNLRTFLSATFLSIGVTSLFQALREIRNKEKSNDEIENDEKSSSGTEDENSKGPDINHINEFYLNTQQSIRYHGERMWDSMRISGIIFPSITGIFTIIIDYLTNIGSTPFGKEIWMLFLIPMAITIIFWFNAYREYRRFLEYSLMSWRAEKKLRFHEKLPEIENKSLMIDRFLKKPNMEPKFGLSFWTTICLFFGCSIIIQFSLMAYIYSITI